jgi:uncharacterized protein involved in outer membrane biogenesis
MSDPDQRGEPPSRGSEAGSASGAPNAGSAGGGASSSRQFADRDGADAPARGSAGLPTDGMPAGSAAASGTPAAGTAAAGDTPPVPASGPGRRILKIVLWTLLALVLLTVVAVIVLLNFDWNRVKPWVNRKVSTAIERPFAINGDLSVHWRRATEAEAGWRRFIPWPHVAAQDITVGDPAAFGRPAGAALTPQQRAALASIPASSSDTAHVRQLNLALSPLPLLDHQVRIPSLELAGARLRLERTADGKVNWTLPQKHDKDNPWKVDVRQLVLSHGNVHYIDAVRHADVTADISSRSMPAAGGKGPAYGIDWKLGGTINKEAVTGGGMAGAVLALQDDATPYPIKADMAAGKSRLTLEGTVTRMRSRADIDVRMTLAGSSLGLLYGVSGIVLPETPAFTTSGHLRGALRDEKAVWRYENFTGRIGSSDIHGDIEFHRGGARPLIKGKLVTDTLVFADLGPLVGADSNAAKRARGAEPQPPGKVLPVERFRTERWNKMDAQVSYTARRIVRKTTLPVNNLSVNVDMHDGVLKLQPLDFGVAGGKLHSNIVLDGRNQTVKADVKAAARALQLKQLFPTFKVMQASFGQIDGDISLKGTGSSIAALLATSDGQVRAHIGSGALSKLLLELAGLNLGNVVLTKISGDRQIRLNCALTDFTVQDGLMQTRVAVVDTPEAVIRADGTVNLATEQLNLNVRPSTKALRIITLRTPFHVQGTFKKPKVGVDMGKIALKAGAAAVLATAAAPVAALLPLINTGKPKQSECGAAAMQDARVAPAPPPPKPTLWQRLTGRKPQ